MGKTEMLNSRLPMRGGQNYKKCMPKKWHLLYVYNMAGTTQIWHYETEKKKQAKSLKKRNVNSFSKHSWIALEAQEATEQPKYWTHGLIEPEAMGWATAFDRSAVQGSILWWEITTWNRYTPCKLYSCINSAQDRRHIVLYIALV